MDHEFLGIKFKDKEIESLTIKRDGYTIFVDREQSGAVIKGFSQLPAVESSPESEPEPPIGPSED